MDEGTIDTAEVIAVPVRINTTWGGVFVVKDIASWTWEEHGLFASGNWDQDLKDTPERDVLIPFQNVGYLEYDFDVLMDAAVEDFIQEATSDES